jgi:hypothetical protein
MMYDNETSEYVYEVGMIDAPDCHWFEGLDRELYIVPGYGLTTDMVGGQEYGVVDFLNLVTPPGRSSRRRHRSTASR